MTAVFQPNPHGTLCDMIEEPGPFVLVEKLRDREPTRRFVDIHDGNLCVFGVRCLEVRLAARWPAEFLFPAITNA
jgi:hypothetical protein